MRSADEAREYVMRLRAILQYIGVNNGDMESGQLRCDANVSLRPQGAKEFGTKVEIKNMNSFRAIHRAIQYEIERQTEVLDGGGRLIQETRGWNDARGLTVSQRTKEFAEDYRYFPEPDLPPLDVSRGWVEEIRAALPELPGARRDRFTTAYGLTPYDASLLTSTRAMAEYFEDTVKRGAPAKTSANWILGDFSRLLNAEHKEIQESAIRPEQLAQLIQLVDSGAISGKMAKQTFEDMYRAENPAPVLEKAKGATQISGDDELQRIADQVIAENQKSVADFKTGKEQALKFLIGQAMKISKGRANPQRLDALLREKIS
jgi:aspartyl-tRNA(Asn)/glutamyl-tRNA(Gln) amidotransferase subunit B